jgi:hypothetical protein
MTLCIRNIRIRLEAHVLLLIAIITFRYHELISQKHGDATYLDTAMCPFAFHQRCPDITLRATEHS